MKIRQIQLQTANIASTRGFYTKLFGAEAVSMNGPSLIVRVGFSLIHFKPCELKLRPIYHFAFNIPCNQIRMAARFTAEITRVLKLGDGSEIADFSAWNAVAFYFNDNNGNVLECIARRDLNNDSDRPFSATSFLSVSEIGIVAGNVQKTIDEIRKRTGETPYEKQPVTANFAAVGDANGLLIISNASRNWFPTNIPAEPFPLEITGEGKQGVFRLNFS